MTTPTPDSTATPPLTLDDLMKAINNLSTELQATKLQVSTLTASGSHAEPRWNKPPPTGWRPPPVRAPGPSPHNNAIPRIRVEAPRFNGDDPAGWIFRIHNYFNYFQTPECERLQLVAMLIDYPASDWFRYYQTNTCGTSWEAFLIAVRQRFDLDYYENYIGSLSKLQQSTTVLDYQTAFESILNKISGVPEQTLIAMYVSGLRQPVQREVNLRNPRTLQEAFGLARELSACHNESSSFRRPWSGRQPVHSTSSTPTASPASATVPGVSSTGKSSTPSAAQHREGVQWLQTLGKVSHDYANMTMEFAWNDHPPPPAAGDEVSFPENIPLPVRAVLDSYSSVFHLPQELPSQGHPLAFFSKKLGPRRRAASTYHKELYAIVESVHKWRQYLLGHEFVIRSDQKSLKDLLCQVIQTPDQQFYIRKLMGFKFRIEYKPGASNKVADALSRRDVMDGQTSDEPAAVFLAFAQPIPTLLQDIRRDNALLEDSCVPCQATKYSTQRPAGLLQPLPIPTVVWDSVSMDFITGLPPSRGITVIMVVVDRLSKYTHFGLLPTGFDAPRVAHLFLDTVVKHHGFPSTIISDRDSVFMSSFWRELMKLSGTTLKFSTAYHPQTEVMNRELEQYLRAFIFERPHKWATFLPWAELALNCSHHDGLNMSPYRALYGRTPPHLFPTLAVRAKVATVEEMLRDRAAVLEDLRHNLAKMQQRMRERANLHRRDVSFHVGDYVLLKLQQHWQHSLARPRPSKLARRYYGPFEVLERIGPVAYRLRLPEGCKIHDVFHVSLLRPFVSGGQPLPEPSLPDDITRGQVMAIPVSAGPRRTVLIDGQPQEQCLVRWSDDGGIDPSWEPVDSLRRNYPTLDLEDKVVLNPGGVDMGPLHVEGHASDTGPTHTDDRSDGEQDGPKEQHRGTATVTGTATPTGDPKLVTTAA
ncbi:unnamed protein product [Cuscuta campestris]|uniref:Integrase catalytic domain-containing protein n=1 Tax=Cuscuta campestris TaxID=132261 RepID=A0A484M2H3_9ASTE|nr:unnamed protein product [Cuscuta campestris]